MCGKTRNIVQPLNPRIKLYPLKKILFNCLNSLSKEKMFLHICQSARPPVSTLKHSIKSELCSDSVVISLSQTLSDDSSVVVLFKCQTVLFKSFFILDQLDGKQQNILIHTGAQMPEHI